MLDRSKEAVCGVEGKSQNKLSKLSNVDEKLTNCGWKSRGFRFLSRVGLKVEICLKSFIEIIENIVD